jgi:uncharacterized surface protein with fasciclin (FAS1) repeats
MLRKKTHIAGGIAMAIAAAFTLAACSSGSGTATETSAAPAPETSEAMETPEAMESMDPMANLVGSGCAAYAEAVPDGSGSVEGMSLDPVATAASNNPILTTLTAAVSGGLNPGVDLVDTLNGGEFTVFAPVDDAFAKIDPATIETLKTDTATLTSILTYHVVPGKLQPSEIVGMHDTVQGGSLEVAGSGDDLTVNGASAVICGGVQTSNAVVYLIDTVLMPPAA